ncbi:hypothetical protein G647_09578 [Cladophialophora carrionii CBS 160.54]|uniref:Uncharacterized protein n=1 Tax=Cladophialophora carrionii CBS 160.54 TaxID=1279043 RepID=V9DM45_9EURO|nr:uncharacterized protein G647_09578 [Cladophialophora carrionii CBS 160.54]ETI27388.1 hypothetical protein G647_09578 [Cladophialophora carrionii CBS 160.54]
MSATSPKRKRGHTLPLDTKVLTPRLLGDSDLEDHAESPRTKFARQFDDLEIHGKQEKQSQDAINISAHGIDAISKHPHEGTVKLGPLASHSSGRGPTSLSMATSDCEPSPSMSPGISPRSKSPPLSSGLSDEFWHDSEITGHDPNDPDDDGYGINGIGFKPTAAIAWTRSQQRKRQLTEWKNREAREARQQRSERRKRLFDDGEAAPSMESSPRKAVRVHFEDG